MGNREWGIVRSGFRQRRNTMNTNTLNTRRKRELRFSSIPHSLFPIPGFHP
jgi:hypothetical protein